MFLVVDFIGLELDLSGDVADIYVDDNDEITLEKFCDDVCNGIERIGGVRIIDRNRIALLDEKGNRYNSKRKLKDLNLNEWDTLYLVKGGTLYDNYTADGYNAASRTKSNRE